MLSSISPVRLFPGKDNTCSDRAPSISIGIVPISWVSTTAVVATEQSALSSSPLLAVAVIEEQSIIAGYCC
ncbi:hypothetical protein LXL04_011741 [Taraxacum kok-saghyz]